MSRNGELRTEIIFYTLMLESQLSQLRYMAELLGVDIPLVGCGMLVVMIPRLLGRLIGDKPWVRNAERAMFGCYDLNFLLHNLLICLNLFLKTKVVCPAPTNRSNQNM